MIFWVAYRPPFDHRENGRRLLSGDETCTKKSAISFPATNQYNGMRQALLPQTRDGTPSNSKELTDARNAGSFVATRTRLRDRPRAPPGLYRPTGAARIPSRSARLPLLHDHARHRRAVHRLPAQRPGRRGHLSERHLQHAPRPVVRNHVFEDRLAGTRDLHPVRRATTGATCSIPSASLPPTTSCSRST